MTSRLQFLLLCICFLNFIRPTASAPLQSYEQLYPRCPLGGTVNYTTYICLEYNAARAMTIAMLDANWHSTFAFPKLEAPPPDWNFCNQTWLFDSGVGFQSTFRCSYSVPGYPTGTIVSFGESNADNQLGVSLTITPPTNLAFPDSMTNLPNLEFPYLIIGPVTSIVSLLLPATNVFGQAVFRPVTSITIEQAFFALPTELGNFPSLTGIYLTGVNNSGIPTQLGLLQNLTELVISAGSCPPKPLVSFPPLGDLTQLQRLKFSCFGITDFPPLIGALTALQSLELGNNLLTTFPPEVSSLSALTILDLSSNLLSGTVPRAVFDKMPGLVRLDMSANRLSGPLPVPNSSVLAQYQACVNQFSGPIPLALSTMTKLTYLDVKFNQLNGTLDFLNNFTSLKQFCAQQNNLTGTIPNMTALTRLVFLDLSTNFLTGTIPSVLAPAYLSVLNNQLTGSFPWTVNMPKQQVAFLNNNFLSGTLPATFFAETTASSIDISHNQFSGPLPPFIHCTLVNFDVSFNYLTGPMSFSVYTTANDNAGACSGQTVGYNPAAAAAGGALRFEVNRLNISTMALDFSKPFFVLPQDTNECTDGTHACDPHATCTDGWNPVLSYTCTCNSGYSPDPNSPLPNQACQNTATTGIIIGVVLGVVFLLLLLLLLLLLIRKLTKYNDLPYEVRRSYQDCESRFAVGWEKRGGSHSSFYFQDYHDLNDPKAARILNLFQTQLHGDGAEQLGLRVTAVTAVYNPVLTESFVNAYHIQQRRLDASKKQFYGQGWKGGEDTANREFVYNAYEQVVKGSSWNKDDQVPIIPALHGTSAAIAEKICETGFANLSSLDDGYYGKGIYFTTWAPYAVPYIASRKDPAMIISWVLPGNAYPVTQHHGSKDSLLGAALQSGYQSHFVCTTPTGEVPASFNKTDGLFDELVIPQENQISPAFILHFEQQEAKDAHQKWQRVMAGENLLRGRGARAVDRAVD